MQLRRLRLLTTVLLVTILVTSGTWLSSLALDKTPWCRITADWAKLHARELPTTLSEFQTIPRPYRGPVWTIMSPEARCHVMRDTFQEAIASGRLTQCSCGAEYWILSDCERNMGM